MKIQYLGTAAFEGWPAMFCKCEACETARRLGGKNIRTRSQSIIDDKLLLDMPADTHYHSLKYNIDFSGIQHILITHSHDDHFYPYDMMIKAPEYSHDPTVKNMYVYGNSVIVRMLKHVMDTSGISDMGDYVIPVEVKPFVPFDAGEYHVTPLLANHMEEEECLIYSIEKDGKSILYAHDTGVLPEKTWEYLQGKHFDAVSFDCTFQLIDWKYGGHMGFPNVEREKKKMEQMGCIDENTKLILNHFTHNAKVPHEEFCNNVSKYGYLTAFDGMTVEF